MKILLDIGNTLLKWGREEAGAIESAQTIDYRQTDLIEQLSLCWSGLDRPQALAISSVIEPELTGKIVDLARELWPSIQPIVPAPAHAAFGVTNAYLQPETLGIDRWLALLATYRHYPELCCIADCGTAITVDVIRADGQHLGGLISPGLRLMQKSLIVNTVNLHSDFELQSLQLANSTAAAINSGSLCAAVGLLEAVLRKLEKPAKLVLTGGDALAIAGMIDYADMVVDSHLVFKGLAIYCDAELA